MEQIRKLDPATKTLEILHYEFAVLIAWICYKGFASYLSSPVTAGDDPYSPFLLCYGLAVALTMIFVGSCAAKQRYMLVFFLNMIGYCCGCWPCGILCIYALILASLEPFRKQPAALP